MTPYQDNLILLNLIVLVTKEYLVGRVMMTSNLLILEYVWE